MTKNETTYDFLNNVLTEYATLVVGVAEIPSKNLEIHRAKFKAVIDLKDATRSVILEMMENRMKANQQASIN